nr:MAG TPA: Tumor necrosis factor receptor superfamily, TWEAK, TNF Receptor, CRD [Caudoviricetes sp.]
MAGNHTIFTSNMTEGECFDKCMECTIKALAFMYMEEYDTYYKM